MATEISQQSANNKGNVTGQITITSTHDSEIHNAIVSGTAKYVLKYSAKTERKWMKVKIIKQPRDV